jgi:DNA polymerase-1
VIVRQAEFTRTVGHLLLTGERSVDTETTGLRAYHDDRLFSIIIADHEKSYYFNFQEYEDLAAEWVLPRFWISFLKPVFSNPDSLWYMTNAKFDMAMLAREGIYVRGPVHCTEALGRVERNDEFAYGLDATAKRLGLEKSEAVKEYIKKHKLYDKDKNSLYYKVPFNVIVPYGELDAKLTRTIGMHQNEVFHEIENSTPDSLPKITRIVENEKKFTKTCFKIEQTGIRLDPEYCRAAVLYETDRYRKAEANFRELTGLEFQDSNAVLKQAFEQSGEQITLTEKGNPSFTDKVLSKYTSPVAKIIQEYRDAYKKANTYYKNFLYFNKDGIIHASIKQGGAKHGRVSVVDPPLQTLADEEDEGDLPFKIRRAFIPRPGTFFLMMDYDQMEYRMMFDYAGQMDFIHEVKAGMDVHDATVKIIKDMLGISITRSQAKTLNFGLLYGMGINALAAALKTTTDKARALKKAYFQALPFVQGFIRKVTARAEANGYIFNWAGRRCYFKDLNFAYTAPNHLISGGCADVVKIAMNQIDDLLEGKKTKMIMQVHDEILFEMVPEEMDLIPQIKEIMEGAYPYKHLKLTVSVEHSFKSWADKVKGIPEICIK